MAEFSGNLESDSPNCSKLLKTHFGAEPLQQIKDLYSELFIQSSIKEPLTNRAAEIRYNPRPARLSHILISEAECRCLSTIKSAFRLSFSENSLILENQTNKTNPDLLYLANLLDELRHLHMHPELNAERITKANLLAKDIQEAPDLNPKLKLMIIKSVQRLSRLKV